MFTQMITLSIVFFALAAIFGLTILVKWLTKKNAPKAVIYSHGVTAVIGVVLLLIYAVQNPENFPLASLLFFGVAAVAGVYMFVMDMKENQHPLGIAFTHALVAVVGVVLLLFFALG